MKTEAKRGPAAGADGKTHTGMAGASVALCGAALVEKPDTTVTRGGWVGAKSCNCIECTKEMFRS